MLLAGLPGSEAILPPGGGWPSGPVSDRCGGPFRQDIRGKVLT
jgi:hypothetical protein